MNRKSAYNRPSSSFMPSKLKKASAMSAALAAVPAADATIFFSGQQSIILNAPGASSQNFPLDLDGDRQDDAVLFQNNGTGSHFALIQFGGLHSTNGVHVESTFNEGVFPKKMAASESIYSEIQFAGGSQYLRISFSPQSKYGVFVGTGYAGLRFNTIAGTRYGWVQLDVAPDGSEIEILGWAYEDSGAGIHAGAIPEPSQVAAGLGLLAMGAAGVREARKRRKTAAQNAS